MKKTFLKASLFVATMTLSLGFASCSDDGDPVTEGNVVPATELSAVANTYVNDIINPTYKDLRDNAKVLKDDANKRMTPTIIRPIPLGSRKRNTLPFPTSLSASI